MAKANSIAIFSLLMACLSIANPAYAGCSISPRSEIYDQVRQRQPGFTACNATRTLLHHFRLPMKVQALEAALGSRGVDPRTGRIIGGQGAYTIHWDGPDSFWNADIVDEAWVKRIYGTGPHNQDFEIEAKLK
ncbi:MAG: hypothetical protein KGK11_00285 [Sphingomonadales bacterium]|nr:hypothetical protein [Sphingomonadales bacterium]